MSLPQSFPIATVGGTANIPSVGFGTWASDGSSPTAPANPEWIIKALKIAFDAGYRHLECAWFYGVDGEIAQAIRENNLSRSEVFICSKIWPTFYHPKYVELCCDKILTDMKIDHLDCLLLHWPVAFQPTSLEDLKDASASKQANAATKKMKLTEAGEPAIDWEHTSEPIARAGGQKGSIVPTWLAMKELVKKGKTRAIGVSNFDIADLKILLPYAKDIPISINQVEAHPWFPNTDLVNFCKENNILVTCFSPFAGQKADGRTLVHDPTVQSLAKKNNMGVGQLLQSWAVQRGTVPLGKSGVDGE